MSDPAYYPIRFLQHRKHYDWDCPVCLGDNLALKVGFDVGGKSHRLICAHCKRSYKRKALMADGGTDSSPMLVSIYEGDACEDLGKTQGTHHIRLWFVEDTEDLYHCLIQWACTVCSTERTMPYKPGKMDTSFWAEAPHMLWCDGCNRTFMAVKGAGDRLPLSMLRFRLHQGFLPAIVTCKYRTKVTRLELINDR